MKKRKSLSINIAVLVITLILSTVMIELFLRVLPQDLTQINYDLITDERIHTANRYVKFKPNYTRVWTGLGPPTVWHYNELGYRERAIQIKKPENIFRIIVIGDSIVMGFGVEDYEAFPRSLEQILKAQKVSQNITHIEVLNMGIQGYSTPQYLSVLQEDAMNFNPDLIIVGVYPSNDLSGGISLKRDSLYIKLLSIPDQIPYPVNQFLKEKSRLHLFALTKYYSFIKRYETTYKSTQEVGEEEWGIVESDLKEMKLSTDAADLPLVVVSIPHPKEVAENSDSVFQKRMGDISKKLNIIYYDPLQDLKKYKTPKALYLDDLDDHFSVEGNQYFAHLLAKYLWDNNLVPKQPEEMQQ